MSVMICITCEKYVDTDFKEFNFDTNQCEECDRIDEELGS